MFLFVSLHEGLNPRISKHFAAQATNASTPTKTAFASPDAIRGAWRAKSLRMNDIPEVAMDCAQRLRKEARMVEAEECIEVTTSSLATHPILQ